MKPFSKWTIAEVEDTFNVVIRKHHKRLTQWLTDIASPTPAEENLLDELCDKLQDQVWDWNECELKGKFIFPLLLAVNFDEEQYKSFMERDISVDINNEKLSGTVDFLVATGKRYPKHPYFFIHEFKKEHESSGDPLGQLLIAMVVAQKLNNDNQPIYGCYVMDRFWFFVVLEDIEYSTSLAFDATKNEIKEIFGILKNTKKIILKIINSS
ncbi:hypothetical protein [Candidatus Parabeggiatoa sp. HSG14]|uniref:hypothetical protein n=1 Tax=Candidatus Parabeggiatoa sp. HSG14 TaxID=3055593 RepID=UPI0025A91456|nr:hypothetical protein [Thiotrichales bacterium HSG14]